MQALVAWYADETGTGTSAAASGQPHAAAPGRGKHSRQQASTAAGSTPGPSGTTHAGASNRIQDEEAEGHAEEDQGAVAGEAGGASVDISMGVKSSKKAARAAGGGVTPAPSGGVHMQLRERAAAAAKLHAANANPADGSAASGGAKPSLQLPSRAQQLANRGRVLVCVLEGADRVRDRAALRALVDTLHAERSRLPLVLVLGEFSRGFHAYGLYELGQELVQLFTTLQVVVIVDTCKI